MIGQSKEYYLASQWSIFFKLLSIFEQRILAAIAREHLDAGQIVDRCLGDPERILLLLDKLVLAGVLSSFDGNGAFAPVYLFNSRDFEDYCANIDLAGLFDPDDVCQALSEEFQRLARRRLLRISELGLAVSIESVGLGVRPEMSITKM